MLTLITQYAAECATKLQLLSFKNKEDIFVNDIKENKSSMQNVLDNKSDKDENNSKSAELSFIHKRQGPSSHEQISPKIKYRLLSVQYHLLLKIKGYFAIKNAFNNKDEKLATHFDKVTIEVTSEGLTIIEKTVFKS